MNDYHVYLIKCSHFKRHSDNYITSRSCYASKFVKLLNTNPYSHHYESSHMAISKPNAIHFATFVLHLKNNPPTQGVPKLIVPNYEGNAIV